MLLGFTREMDVDMQNKKMSKHIMFSYQWNSQELVSKIFSYLTKVQSIPVWMDTHGGMNECLTTSMAEGVENCCVLVCFLTPEYQESLNCKKELTYASELHKPIIPCIIGSENKTIKWKPSKWLGITITDLLYLNLIDINENNFAIKCQDLISKINFIVGIKESQSLQHQPSIKMEEETDEDFEISTPLIIPPIIRQGPQINDELPTIIPKKYSSEGDSVIRLLNQSTEIESNQDFWKRNDGFFNSFTLSRVIVHNTSSQPISILQLSAEYENIIDKENQWIPCQITTNQNDEIINIDSNKLIGCSLTIKIQVNGSPGVDNERRSRAHHLLPQPLRLKIIIEDTQMKHASLIVEQVNRPLKLPTLDKLMIKLNVDQSNILGFVWADDCSIDTRYFAFIYYSIDHNPLIYFSFSCDLSSSSTPFWDRKYIQNLQKTAKQDKKSELIVLENVFDPFAHCVALFDEYFKLQAIRIKIKTETSTTIQTIPLPMKQIFTESQSF